MTDDPRTVPDERPEHARPPAPEMLQAQAPLPAQAEDLPPEPAPAAGSAVGLAAIIAAIALGLVAWSAISDRYAPSTSRATVSAQVIQIAPRVAGRVTEVLVTDNAIVEPGAALFHIDSRPYELAVSNAQARLREAGQGVSASTAQIEAAQAQVAQARVNVDRLRADADRLGRLAERGTVPRVQADQATSQLEAAEASLATTIAQAEAAQRQLGDAEHNPQLDSARLGLEQAEYDLASTTVMAPGRGVVTNLHLAVGQFVGTGSPALTYIDSQDVWITAELRENQLRGVKPGDRVEISFDAAPGRIFPGTVGSIGWGIAAGPSQAGGLPVNAAPSQWFEPARRMPVRVDFDMREVYQQSPVRVGGQADLVIYPEQSGLVGTIASGLLRLRSWLSYLH
ncbi:MAG: HlyD family secretion protein [Paracoccus sp. (in: a-proteobacteria)]|nr:HlyD family secretion protein [Paracoccus sp. (in: a-proteobacteria)]